MTSLANVSFSTFTKSVNF